MEDRKDWESWLKFIPVNAAEFGGYPQGEATSNFRQEVDPAPLVRLMVAAIGDNSDLLDLMEEVATDERDGPIHIVHLIAACDLAARDVGGGLLANGSILGIKSHTVPNIMVSQISPRLLPELVFTLRRDGLAAATAIARKASPRERFRALDALMMFATGPILKLHLDVHDGIVRIDGYGVVTQRPESSGAQDVDSNSDGTLRRSISQRIRDALRRDAK
jgi:hypothetical protein